MTRGATIALVIILAAAASPAVAADEYRLYRPEKVQTQNIPSPGEGVLTKTIIIQKGDTLKKLSRRYSGRDSFFPQILLFNRIKDPDLILAGAQLQIPLTNLESAAVKGGIEKQKRHVIHKGAHKRRHAARSYYGGKEERLFNRGVSAFKAGEYRRAIEIFDKYLATYPNSPSAANAALYRAESYENLAGQ